jgi:hypothetical protein
MLGRYGGLQNANLPPPLGLRKQHVEQPAVDFFHFSVQIPHLSNWPTLSACVLCAPTGCASLSSADYTTNVPDKGLSGNPPNHAVFGMLPKFPESAAIVGTRLRQSNQLQQNT